MKQPFLIILFSVIYLSSISAQEQKDFVVPKAISFETQLILRGERDDRGGVGMNLIVGSVHRKKPASRFRFNPSLEIGIVSWPDRNEVTQTNSYGSLNLAAQFDIVRINNFSIPVNAGFIFDMSFKQDEPAIFNGALRFGFSSRIESLQSSNAFEFLSIGFTVSTNVVENSVAFASFYMGILKVEHKF